MKHTMKELLTFERSPMGLYRRFRKDEDGSLLYFGLLMFILVLWFGGMAVDLMRYETTRAQLQGSLDRATLAAADLDQTLSPADVVRDYMDKDNTSQFLDGEPEVEEGINYRVVSVDATVDMPLFFYDLPRIFMSPFTTGMTALSVSGASTAEERVTDVEISLVLDVSGSMNSDSRIENLRPAAREFVTTVLANNVNAPEGLITISMIPYSAVVNPGNDIADYLDSIDAVDRSHKYSTCLRFDDDEFDTTELDLTVSYDHIAHFDPNVYSDADDYQPINYPWCYQEDYNAIIAPTTDEDRLHDAIDALEPYGNTAIDMGVKWGVALLDPSTQSLITHLAGATGTGVPAIADGRPELHTETDVLKVLVLMTDGENTTQYDLLERFKFDLSFVWFDLDDPDQSIEDASSSEWSIQYSGQRTPTVYSDDRFYWNRYSESTRLKDYPMGFANYGDYVSAREAEEGELRDIGEGIIYPDDSYAYQASWQDLFATYVYSRVNNELMSRATNHNVLAYSDGTGDTVNDPDGSTIYYKPDYIDSSYSLEAIVNSSEADDRLSDLCTAARDAGIIIYTVAFEAPSAGQTALLDCASSVSHYFDVSGTDISDAFSAIASDIRALKLTQ